MKVNFLFPHRAKKWGWLILAASLVLIASDTYLGHNISFLNVYIGNVPFFISDGFTDQNLADEIECIGLIIGLGLIGFSKLKVEDEHTQKIRLDSLLWATYLNYSLIIIAVIFVYGISFLHVMIYNLFTILIFFIVRFHIYLARK